MPLQAYSVTDTEENTGTIIFAARRQQALRRGARMLSDADASCVECQRAPWADRFKDTQQVPASTAIANGWWFECAGCGRTLNDEFFCDAPNRRYAQVVGPVNGPVYCSKSCKSRCEARRRAANRAQNRMINILTDLITKRFPDAEIIMPGYAYASERAGRRHVVDDASVKFKFPGMIYGPASLSMRRPQFAFIGPLAPAFNCCNGDLATFQAYAQVDPALRPA